MYEASAFTPAFTYLKDKDNRYVFQVKNTRNDANLTRVSFSCWVTFDGRRSKTDLIVRPLYQDGSTYSVHQTLRSPSTMTNSSPVGTWIAVSHAMFHGP